MMRLLDVVKGVEKRELMLDRAKAASVTMARGE
jgi:hypothetical protein